MNIKNKNILFCFFLYFWGICVNAYPLNIQNIIPVPAKMKQNDGAFMLSEKTKLYIDLKGEEECILRNCLEQYFFRMQKGKKRDTKNTIILSVTKNNKKHKISPERYTLSVTPQTVLIQATSGAGLFYGIQTLYQLAQPLANGFSIASTEIEDEPRFAYRGFMLDVSRHFFSKEFVKKQIDALAFYKINRLHLHLTDAAGWRVEIKKYPLLTDFAAWRTEGKWKKWWNGDRKYLYFNDPKAAGGYYTQDDIREIVDYAREHYITVIPEIEMPAHSEEVLAAYPQLSCVGEPYKNADFCIGNEETFEFLEGVLTEIMELFPSEYIHIGGDEAGKAAWKECPKCLRRMKEEQLTNVDELQSYLIHRIELFLNAHGRKLLGWDEILQGGLAPNATVMSWRGEQGGISAVQSGHQAIMTPGKYCYFDAYQDAPHTQPEAIGGYLPLKKVYDYNPIPDSLSAKQANLIRGVQANLWTEYVSEPSHVEYMIYPRLLALAEVAWSQPERKSWNDFYQRALQAVENLKSRGYHPFDLKKEIGSRPEATHPISHLALDKKVIYHAPYHNAYPAKGDITLTDGIRGDWTYTDGAWQGFISPKRLDITIDMETEMNIQTITADFMQVTGAEIYLPASVVISISSDGNTFTELMRKDYEVDLQQPIRLKTIKWKGSASARYIRYQACATKQHGGWIFTDEIIVQ